MFYIFCHFSAFKANFLTISTFSTILSTSTSSYRFQLFNQLALAVQLFSIPTHFLQEMHFLVSGNAVLQHSNYCCFCRPFSLFFFCLFALPYVFWLSVTSAYFHLFKPFNFSNVQLFQLMMGLLQLFFYYLYFLKF